MLSRKANLNVAFKFYEFLTLAVHLRQQEEQNGKPSGGRGPPPSADAEAVAGALREAEQLGFVVEAAYALDICKKAVQEWRAFATQDGFDPAYGQAVVDL